MPNAFESRIFYCMRRDSTCTVLKCIVLIVCARYSVHCANVCVPASRRAAFVKSAAAEGAVVSYSYTVCGVSYAAVYAKHAN